MLRAESTPNGMGIRLLGDGAELKQLGIAIGLLSARLPNEGVADVLETFGKTLRLARKHPIGKKNRKLTPKPAPDGQMSSVRFSCRVNWPRLLYCLNVLQTIDLSDLDSPGVRAGIEQLSNLTCNELIHWERHVRVPLAIYARNFMPLYQGDHVHGLLYMAELGWSGRQGGLQRMEYLGTVLDLLTPGAWIHHDTLHFVAQLPHQYPGNGMAILQEDTEYALAMKRW